MAKKQVIIDLEAYDRLRRARRKGESFSDTIKRCIPAPIDVVKWLKVLESDPVSEEFVEAVERQVARRRNKPLH